MTEEDKKNIQKITNIVSTWPVCPSWVLSFEVFNRELIKEYKTRNYFGIVPEISEKQQDSIITVWEYEMSRSGWSYGDSIYDKQDKFERDCDWSLGQAIYQVMSPKIKPIIRTRFCHFSQSERIINMELVIIIIVGLLTLILATFIALIASSIGE
jgi:hypothetical protein